MEEKEENIFTTSELFMVDYRIYYGQTYIFRQDKYHHERLTLEHRS